MTARFLVVFVLAISAVACTETKGLPTEFARACDPDNEKRVLEISGVLDERGGVFCSNRGGTMECGFDLLASANSNKKFTAYIEQGTGPNTMDSLDKGYKRTDIKIRDKSGNPVDLGSDTVTITGRMNVMGALPGGQGVCFMQVERIDK